MRWGLLASLFAVFGCAEPAPEPFTGPPNVLVLSVESLRWDRLGAAGYARPITPHIDSIARRGAYFRRAYAQSSWTRPSVASTFTSAYPSAHNVHGEEGIGPVFRRPVHRLSRIPEEFETAAELFRVAGYRSHGWSSNSQLWTGLGFAQGFDEYEGVKVPDPEIVEKLEALIARPAGEPRRPFLAFVHFLAPHLPYEPEPPPAVRDPHPEGVSITGQNYQRIQDGEMALSPADLAHNVALYDATIAEVDARIGAVLRALEAAGIADETLVVVMADHGQEFYEHGKVAHGHTLYDELIRVPLVMAGPGVPRGVTVDAPVQNLDLLPTLLELASLPIPADLQGRSLAPWLAPDAVGAPRPAFSELGDLHRRRGPGRGHLYAVVDGEWKYVFHAVDGRRELYRIVDDPYEQRDLAADPASQPVLERMAAHLYAFIEANRVLAEKYPSAMSRAVPDDVMERMRALGYVE